LFDFKEIFQLIIILSQVKNPTFVGAIEHKRTLSFVIKSNSIEEKLVLHVTFEMFYVNYACVGILFIDKRQLIHLLYLMIYLNFHSILVDIFGVV
jgi:hypothetical protein